MGTNKSISIVMALAAGLGLILGFTAAPISAFSVGDWISGIAVTALLIGILFYMFQGRSPIGAVPTDDEGRRRWRMWSIIGIVAMVFVLALNIGAALTGSWDPSDGFIVGVWLALLVLFIARLRQLSSR